MMFTAIRKYALVLLVLLLICSSISLIFGSLQVDNTPLVDPAHLIKWLNYLPISKPESCLFLNRDGNWVVRCLNLNLPEGVLGWMQSANYEPCINNGSSWDCQVSWDEQKYGRIFSCTVWTGLQDYILYLIVNCEVEESQPILFAYPLGYYLGP